MTEEEDWRMTAEDLSWIRIPHMADHEEWLKHKSAIDFLAMAIEVDSCADTRSRAFVLLKYQVAILWELHRQAAATKYLGDFSCTLARWKYGFGRVGALQKRHPELVSKM